MKLKMKKVAFEGWKNCVEIASGDFRLIVTTDVGPRIIGGFLGKNGKNIFHVDPKLAGKSGGDKWVNYGGHRLWHSPEIKERTYVPDNDPIQVVNNLSDFIFGLIRAVGLILLGWGIVQVGLSFSSHDPSQRSNGFLTLAGGVVITFAKEILTLITG